MKVHIHGFTYLATVPKEFGEIIRMRMYGFTLICFNVRGEAWTCPTEPLNDRDEAKKEE